MESMRILLWILMSAIETSRVISLDLSSVARVSYLGELSSSSVKLLRNSSNATAIAYTKSFLKWLKGKVGWDFWDNLRGVGDVEVIFWEILEADDVDSPAKVEDVLVLVSY